MPALRPPRGGRNFSPVHTADQLSAALAGRYTIERQIGAGGMATVFLARDLKHNRQVALKVLNPELGAVLGFERFMAEIEVTANLHHPNLLPLFDSGEANGLLFYAMPFIEGETLRARLQRERQLGVDEAVRIAVAIAGALDYAHRHAVIHRDLKPENILMHEGQPLVMDFGIALAVSKAGGARITQTGLSLGTPQYMSPEQATGDHVLDARSDIYSLGAVLYEMLVGDPPHTGSTVQAVIAKVITEQPSSVRATRPNVTEAVEAAVLTALAKIPADRFATAADFSAALTGLRPVTMPTAVRTAAHAGGNAPSAQGGALTGARAAWGVAALAIAAAAWSGLGGGRASEAVGTLGRFEISMPDSVQVATGEDRSRLALSRDGALVAFVGSKRGELASQVYIRRADQPEATPLRGTEEGWSPTFSPSGEWLLYGTNRAVMKIPVAGGTPSVVTATQGRPSGLTWGDNDVILYTDLGSLWMTTAEGKEPRVLVARDSTRVGAVSAFQAHLLPGSRHALVALTSVPVVDSITLGVVSLEDGAIVNFGVRGFAPRFVAPNRLVFARVDGVIFAVPFSLRRRALDGEPVRVLDGVAPGGTATSPDLALADNGWLLYRPQAESVDGTMVMVDRTGRERPLRPNPDRYSDPAISPDGQRIAIVLHGGRFNAGDIWMHEVQGGAWYRVTSDGGSYRPRWSRDGSRVLYVNSSASGTRILSRTWDGSGSVDTLLTRSQLAEIEPGLAGGLSAIRTLNGPRDIFLAPTDSLSAMRPFVVGPADETNPAISPDGRWIAYMSNETGAREVYVRPLTGPGPRVAVSVGGGSNHRWSPDGGTLYYRGTTHIMAATLGTQNGFAVTRRDSLFADTFAQGIGSGWDVMPNGREFVMVRGPAFVSSPMLLVVNWTRLLQGDRSTAEEP